MIAAVEATASPLDCPVGYEPAGEISRCFGGPGQTSFVGVGLVDAEAADVR